MMDYEDTAARRITSVFEDKPRVREVIVAMPRQLTIFEQVADQVRDERSVDLAIGIQLDKVGEIVGESRQGRDDETYRQAIKFRIFVNVSKGRPSDVITATKTLTQGDDIQYLESYPATVYMFSDGYMNNADIPAQVQEVAPAAISDIPVVASFGETPFRTSNPTTAIDDESELAGVQLGVFVGLGFQRLLTVNNRRLRIRQDYQVLPAVPRLNGVFQE